MFSRRTVIQDASDAVCVPAEVIRRVARVTPGTEAGWIDQTLYLIGSNVTHHQPGDPLLDEAIASAQALLALLVQMRRFEP